MKKGSLSKDWKNDSEEIFGLNKQSGESWRIKIIIEIDGLMNKNIREIKLRRLAWLGHVEKKDHWAEIVRLILKKIVGLNKQFGESRRIKIIIEIDGLMNKNIREIKLRRLAWLGHVEKQIIEQRL